MSLRFTKFMLDVVEEVVRDKEEEVEGETFTLQSNNNDNNMTKSKTKDLKDVKVKRLINVFFVKSRERLHDGPLSVQHAGHIRTRVLRCLCMMTN